MILSWKGIFKNSLAILGLVALWLGLLYGLNILEKSFGGTWYFTVLNVLVFIGFVAASVALAYYGIFCAANIRDEFYSDGGDVFGLIESLALTLSLFFALLIYRPEIIDFMNNRILVYFFSDFRIPRVAPAGLLRWILLGFFGVVFVGLSIYQLIKAKQYFIITYVCMHLCGLTLSFCLVSAITLIVLAVSFTVMLLIGVVVCVFIFSVIGGLGETSAGETYVVNKKSGEKKFVARTTADTYTDTDGRSYKVDENDNITKIEG